MTDFTDPQKEGYRLAGFRMNGQRRTLQRCLLGYIMNTYPIGRRKDEIEFGEYRTKRAMLEIYHAMTTAIRTGHSYQTRFTPPAGPPAEGFPAWLPGTDKPQAWPFHVNPPREAAMTKQGFTVGHPAKKVLSNNRIYSIGHNERASVETAIKGSLQ